MVLLKYVGARRGGEEKEFAARQSLPRPPGSACLVAKVATEEGVIITSRFQAEDGGGVGGTLCGLELLKNLAVAASMQVGLLLGGEAVGKVLEMRLDFAPAMFEQCETSVAFVKMSGLEQLRSFSGTLSGEAAKLGFDSLQGMPRCIEICGELSEEALFGLFATAAEGEYGRKREDKGHALDRRGESERQQSVDRLSKGAALGAALLEHGVQLRQSVDGAIEQRIGAALVGANADQIF